MAAAEQCHAGELVVAGKIVGPQESIGTASDRAWSTPVACTDDSASADAHTSTHAGGIASRRNRSRTAGSSTERAGLVEPRVGSCSDSVEPGWPEGPVDWQRPAAGATHWFAAFRSAVTHPRDLLSQTYEHPNASPRQTGGIPSPSHYKFSLPRPSAAEGGRSD